MLARPEHGIVLPGFAAQFREGNGDRGWQLDGAGLAALAEDCDLDAVAVGRVQLIDVFGVWLPKNRALGNRLLQRLQRGAGW